MFGYDRINERFLLENVNRYEMPAWAQAEHMENCEGFLRYCLRTLLGK